jgi:hypothetical protein
MPKGVDEKASRCCTLGACLDAELASPADAGENGGMDVPGRVQNGVVVLEGVPVLPEGAKVTVSYHGPIDAGSQPDKQRIEVPLVRTGEPGTVHLTGQRVAEILDEEDASPRR